LVLGPGFVCDPCNQYFGSKVEQKVVGLAPFGIERVRADVPTKKGKPAVFRDPAGLNLFPTGFLNHVVFAAEPRYYLRTTAFSFPQLVVSPTPQEDFHLVRFLLKMGLEMLLFATDDIDPYASTFNRARQFARYGGGSPSWEFAMGTYPRADDLIISERVDEHGPLVTHQLYQYQLGQMFSRDIGFCFMYRTHLFACNLSNPSITEYLSGFNSRNSFQLQRIVARTHPRV
jgi:hypothetical protein